MKIHCVTAVAVLLFAGSVSPGAEPSDREVRQAIDKAAHFFVTHCSTHPGRYVWRVSKDLTMSEGEAETDADTAWLQPPGTPTVGEAFLDAYEATGNSQNLQFATEVGFALADGRRQSGGWYYSMSFDPEVRAREGYVGNRSFKPKKSGRDKHNVTTLDDDTTPAVIRCLVRLDSSLTEPIDNVSSAAIAGLDTLVDAQRANGGWPQNWSRYPKPDTKPPVGPATPPKTWSRKWLNDWPGQYYLNDDVAGQTIRALLDGYDHFKDAKYLEAAKRGGEFLQVARLPEPQPGWAQQYDADMHPCWDRKFEPPAISGHESEDAIRILIELAERTGETRFLDGLDRSLDYLDALEIAPGKLARFYELVTDKPLYFDSNYQLTYDGSDVPDHYGFVFDSGVSPLRRKLERVRAGRPQRVPRPSESEVRSILKAQNDEGGWLSDRGMKGFRKASREGVYESDVFAENVNTLARYLKPEIPRY